MARDFTSKTLYLKPPVANALKKAAQLSRQSETQLIERLIISYLEDLKDVEAAKIALAEPGKRLTLQEIKTLHGF